MVCAVGPEGHCYPGLGFVCHGFAMLVAVPEPEALCDMESLSHYLSLQVSDNVCDEVSDLSQHCYIYI